MMVKEARIVCMPTHDPCDRVRKDWSLAKWFGAVDRSHSGEAFPQGLTTIGQTCPAVRTETLSQLLDWSLEMAKRKHWSATKIKAAQQII